MFCFNIFALWILSDLLTRGSPHKIAIFVPDMTRSQVIFNARVAEELANAGHNVTLIRIQLMKNFNAKVKVQENIEQWKVGESELDYEEGHRIHSAMIYKEFSMFDPGVMKQFNMLFSTVTDVCATILKNKEFMDRLIQAKFDIGFAHMYDMCPIGLIHAAKMPTWIWLNSAQLLPDAAQYVGVPSPPSYVPPLMSEFTDRMTFIERTKSLVGNLIMAPMRKRMVIDPETEVFRKYWDPNFPDLIDLARKCPLLMVNSNELYNLPRPTLHKIVNIGGIGMSPELAKPLTGEFEKIAQKAEHIALMTFGSHANASAMPDSWKDAFLTAFSNFPEVEFIVRYTTHDLDSRLPKNVHLSSWIPQSDLLQHEKTRVLITHGGYNSLQEAIYSATPMVTIALFGDQFANAALAAQHGFAYNVLKKDVSAQSITDALREVLQKPSYTERVRRMNAMVKRKPEKPEELLVKWTEFVAEFGQLDNLTPYGTQLNFVQYFCIDVILFLFLVVLLALALIIYLFSLPIFFIKRKFCSCSDTAKPKLKKH